MENATYDPDDPNFDTEDYEYRQDLSDGATGDGGPLKSVFDAGFNGSPHSEMYRSWVEPELFRGQPSPRLENWPDDDLVAYCGGEYAKAAYLKETA
jgi:hypothetical protein